MSALRGGRSFEIGRASLSVRTTWWGHLPWVLGAGLLSLAVAANFVGLLELPRPTSPTLPCTSLWSCTL